MADTVLYPSEIRRKLIADHRELREILDEVAVQGAAVVAGDVEAEARLVAAIGNLRVALEAHNANEEQYLRPLLRDVDAWGSLRVDQMIHHHVVEHATFRAFFDLEDRKIIDMAAEVGFVAGRLRAHMDEEESTFLRRDVLRDDLVTTGPTS